MCGYQRSQRSVLGSCLRFKPALKSSHYVNSQRWNSCSHSKRKCNKALYHKTNLTSHGNRRVIRVRPRFLARVTLHFSYVMSRSFSPLNLFDFLFHIFSILWASILSQTTDFLYVTITQRSTNRAAAKIFFFYFSLASQLFRWSSRPAARILKISNETRTFFRTGLAPLFPASGHRGSLTAGYDLKWASPRSIC